jgi:salicylate 5-hydroxylase small subunit
MDLQNFIDVQALHLRYAQILDSNDFAAWPDLFIADGVYKIQSRENFEAGLPLCILHFESQAMLRDRVYGAQHTIYHDPYYQRHVVSAPLITEVQGDVIEAETSYLVLRTHRDKMPEILSVGRYIDRMVHDGTALKFAQRVCVFDNDLIANSLIKPI